MARFQDMDSALSLVSFYYFEPEQAESEIKALLEVDTNSPGLEEQGQVKGIATYLQYLAKLHLLSNGNEKHSDMLPDVVVGNYALEFDAVMPWAFLNSLAKSELPTPADFDMDRFEPATSDFHNANIWDLFTVPVRIPYGAIHMMPRMGHEFESYMSAGLLPSDGFGLKRIAASFLLSGLLNYETATRYGNDRETLELVSNAGNNYASAFADAIVAGKIRACPHCSRPFLKPKESSMGYCSASCRTLYNRAAKKAAAAENASIDSVHAAFPEISEATIAEWFKAEGR